MEPEFQEMAVIKTEVEDTSSYPPRAASPLLLPLMSTDPHLNLPATTALEFQNFERDINEDFTKECIFVNELRETEAPSLDKYIRKCLRKIITDEAARKFSWRGNKRNIPVNNYSVLRILKYEASQKFPNTPINSVDPIVRRWFRYAKDRFNKKFKYYTSYCSSSKLLALRRAS